MKRLWLLTVMIAGTCAANQNSNAKINPTEFPTTTITAMQQAASPLPNGGTDVIGSDTFAAFKGSSSPEVNIDLVSTNNSVFSKIWRVSGLKPLPQPFSSQLSANNTVPIKKDDVMLVQFWARSIGGKPAQTEFVFELGVTPYTQSVIVGAQLTPAWVLYSTGFRAGSDFAIGAASAHFRLGYNDQAFELGGVVFKNFARTQSPETLPFTGFTYAGREANAPWRAAADARIDRIRKADLRVKVVNANGRVVPNATVNLEMQRHAFKFGTSVLATGLLENTIDAIKYRKTILELFNHVVLESDLKWPDWEEYGRIPALAAIKYFKSQNITMRGHNLIWPCDNDYCLPADVPALFGDPTKLRSRIDSHLVDILGATKGQMTDWDVINEPSANKRLSNVLGEDEMAAQIRRAKTLDPNAKTYLNDANNLGEGSMDLEFKRIIARMIALKAPLEGIGLQGHFGYQLTPPTELFTRLTSFGQFGLPLAITEFDVNMFNDQLQAEYLRDFMTVAFSSPNVESFLMWGFWEGKHWIPNAALYRKDWSIKPNGQAYKDLVLKRWWTKASGPSDATGRFGTRGFLGSYKLTVKLGAKTVVQNIVLEKTAAEFVVKLP